MAKQSNKLLRWSPRILGILVCLFLSLFALDAFGGGTSFTQALPGFAIHVAPVLILLAVVGVLFTWSGVYHRDVRGSSSRPLRRIVSIRGYCDPRPMLGGTKTTEIT